jgi:hypothetical protein
LENVSALIVHHFLPQKELMAKSLYQIATQATKR